MRKRPVTRIKIERIYGECFDIVEHLSTEALRRLGESEERIREFQAVFGEIAAEKAEEVVRRLR